MKLSISNIGWSSDDETVYKMMQDKGFTGLEIAPTRIIPDAPYDHLEEAGKWAAGLKENYGFVVPSMQSIWYGRTEKIFGTEEERQILIDYTKKAIDFAAAVGCGNLVFGCPKNRSIPVDSDSRMSEHDGIDLAGSNHVNSDVLNRYYEIGVNFFRELGDYAAEKGTVIGMEANPAIYGANYVNYTEEALELISQNASSLSLVILDLILPGIKGLEVLKRLKKQVNRYFP